MEGVNIINVGAFFVAHVLHRTKHELFLESADFVLVNGFGAHAIAHVRYTAIGNRRNDFG
jgi:hypothetical protein